MLGLLAPLASRVVGLDASHAMLSVARANLEKAGVGRIELRQGDIHAPPVEANAFDLVVIHQVLHYLDDPARALREATRLVAPGGRMLIVDFAPHGLEFLREKQAHRRLGFSHEQIGDWLEEAGLDCTLTRDLPPASGDQGRAHRVNLAGPGPPRADRLALAAQQQRGRLMQARSRAYRRHAVPFGFLRVLSAQDAGNGGHPVVVHRAPGPRSARPSSRVTYGAGGSTRERTPQHRVAHRQGNGSQAGSASHLRRRHARRRR